MAWTAPRTWTDDEVVTAALLNTHLRDNMLFLSTHTHSGAAGDGNDELAGVDSMNFDFIGCIFPVIIAAFLFMPYLWIAGVYTIPEYLGRRYHLGVRTFFAIVWVFFMMATLGTIYVSAAAMFEVLLGWSFWFSVGVSLTVVGLYTTMGGLKAVVFTDALSSRGSSGLSLASRFIRFGFCSWPCLLDGKSSHCSTHPWNSIPKGREGFLPSLCRNKINLSIASRDSGIDWACAI